MNLVAARKSENQPATQTAKNGMKISPMSRMSQKAADGMVIPPIEKRKPIVVSNPNDPRLRAYQDSANVHDLQKYEIANWNKLVKMNPAQRNVFYEKEHLANATDPKQLRYNQRTSTYNLNLRDKDLNMIGTNQYIDSPGIRHHRPLPFPAPQQPVVFEKTVLKKVPASRRNNDMVRTDGTMKGKGFFGLIKRPDGNVSSEISITTQDVIPGKETLIPTMVPTLTNKEIDHLLSGKYNPQGREGIDDVISRKAIDFARQRAAAKKPFFATQGEEGKFKPQAGPIIEKMDIKMASPISLQELPLRRPMPIEVPSTEKEPLEMDYKHIPHAMQYPAQTTMGKLRKFFTGKAPMPYWVDKDGTKHYQTN